jgi:glycosyltransferase involved in cell wall biosynthesis
MPQHIDAPQSPMVSDPSPNILQLCLSKSWGGLEMYPAHIGAALVRHGCLVHGVALEGTSVADSFAKAGLPHLTFGSHVHALLAVKKTLDYIRRHHITVIHAHKSGDMRLASLLVQFAPHLKLFFTDHMGVSMSKKDWLHRWMYSKATRLFSISRVTHARNLNAFPLPPERITQLYYGIDFRPYKPPSSLEQRQQVRRALKVPVNGLLLGIPGRINRGKGQMQWVQALSVLAMKPLTVDWHAVIIGEASGEDALEGGYKAQLVERITALGLSSRVTLAGFQSQMAQCLQAIDIAAIPSHNEAFGFSVIEAMAAGCAVIGSNSGAIPELINADVGLLVNPDDSQAFADALATLMQNDEQRHRFGQRARNFALENFDMDAHIIRLLEYYRA